jgi:hypothetical protein
MAPNPLEAPVTTIVLGMVLGLSWWTAGMGRLGRDAGRQMTPPLVDDLAVDPAAGPGDEGDDLGDACLAALIVVP